MGTTSTSLAVLSVFVLGAGLIMGASHPDDAAQRGAQTPPPAAGAAATGTITGHVLWTGALPDRPTTPVPAAMAACGGSLPFQALAVGSDHGVEWAMLSVVGATGTASPRHVVLGQTGCEFGPHVAVAPVGSTLEIQNHDPLLHNVHALRASGTVFNVASINGMTVNQTLSAPGVMTMICDAGHPWMFSYVHVVTDPFHAVTDAHGAFHIDNVPAGHYTLRMWHEGWTPRPSPDGHAAFNDAVTQDKPVVVTAGGTVDVGFTLPH